jgi:hypothetical protein
MKKPKDLKLGNRVYIQWVDSFGSHGWQNVDTLDTPYPITSIGILVNYNNYGISIVHSVDPVGHKVNCTMTIPWVAIIKFKQFEHVIDVRWNDGTD